ncbi:MAG: apolipoprotein N-acyltransferase [Deltaproteobacteria bacterium]|nr:MAG: apolipoprotein N-acyltransferase [Deltaproteobacteria bacterium]
MATSRSPLSGWTTGVLVALAAALTVASSPPIGIAPLAFAMLAPLVAALDGRRARDGWLLAYAYHVAMAVGIVRWLVHPMVHEYGLSAPPAWLFTVLLVAAYSAIPATAAALYCALRPRLHPAAAPLVFAALWSLAEWLRSEPGGLPWLLTAHPLFGFPLAIQTAALGGVYAVGFVVAALSAALGIALVRRTPIPLVLPALLGLCALAYGAREIDRVASPGDAIRAGLVQASVPQRERFTAGSAERNVRRHIELTRALAATQPLDLAIWSETSVDTDLDATPRLGDALARLAREIGAPVVTGAPRSAHGRRTNAVVLVTPQRGVAESYDKQVLVPFSEFDPVGGSLLRPLLGPVMAGEPYEAGLAATVFRQSPVALATPVCFEITYPALMRRFRSNGARLLVNLSNDAWFGRTGYSELHFAHAVFRAVELRSWVLRVANTGVSGVIDPTGRIVATLPTFEEATLVAQVHAAGPPPFYARFGDGPVLAALSAVTLVGALASRAVAV